MNFDNLTQFLAERLKKPLPGLAANEQMSATMINGDRSKFEYKDPPKKGSVMILLYPDSGTVRFPLIQRPEYPGVHSGQMALPGGKQEIGENEIEAALRETEEEIGVKQTEVEVVGTLSSFYVFASNFQIQPVVGMVTSKPKFVAQESEVAEIVKADLLHLMDEKFRKEKIVMPRAGFELRAPYFDLEGKTVWGATAMMLNEFKMIVKEYYG